jgi:type IV pilus assembly protein PilC
MMQKVCLACFCQLMVLMTGAWAPLIQTLELVSRKIGLYPFAVALKHIKDDLYDFYHGKLLHESMARFPGFELRMI